MGTLASPNLVLTIIDLATGNPDTGETVEILLDGDTYPGDAVALSEIGSTGRYKKETGSGVAAVLQGIYHVYVGGSFNSVFTHGWTGVSDHIADVADPHAVAAEQVAVVDSEPHYSGNDVEAILAEIGADLDGKADSNTTVLLDNSSQTVISGKPVVTNFNADKLDGRHAGAEAGNIPILNGDADVPLDNIPDTLTGKDADTVDGKHVGEVNGTLPELGAGAGKLNTTVLGKAVGSADTNIPQVSTSKVAGKLDDTLLGVELGTVVGTDIPTVAQARHRTATINQGDSPDPDTYGGGTVWIEVSITDTTDAIEVDNSMDWRDRFIDVSGLLLIQPAIFLPGGDNDAIIVGSAGPDLDTESGVIHGFEYTEQGSDGSTAPIMVFSIAGHDNIRIYADSTSGFLMCKKAAATGTVAQLMAKVAFSPDQGHYS